MKCIDFDKEFSRYVTLWVQQHGKAYKNYDAMEAAMPEVYGTFLDTPATWLGGAKPGEYFLQYTAAKQLVDWMDDYFKQRVPVPDMLLNRIAELGLDAEGPLMSLLTKEKTPIEARMSAITLLNEIGSIAPLPLYVAWQQNRDDQDELADHALDSLQAMGEAAVFAMRGALKDANAPGQEALLTLLADYPMDAEVVDIALKLVDKYPSRAALLSEALGKLGDARALPILIRIAGSEMTPYLDYIELRNAIEMLGGEAPERDFAGSDPGYDALRSLED